MTNVAVTYAAPLGLFGLIVAGLIFVNLKRQPVGSELMADLALQIKEGARAFLRREYSVLIPFIIVVAILLFFALVVPASVSTTSEGEAPQPVISTNVIPG